MSYISRMTWTVDGISGTTDVIIHHYYSGGIHLPDEWPEDVRQIVALANREWLDAEPLNSARYVLASGEASRPEYLVVDQDVVDWLDMDDCGKYDWDGYDGAEGDEDAEHAYMRARDIEYVRAHAVGKEVL